MKSSMKLCLAIAMALSWAGSASADTLIDALAAAYNNNPDLRAARAGLRATDEGVVRAQAGFLPSVTGIANLSSQNQRSFVDGVLSSDFTQAPKSYEARIDQNLFRGFQDLNARRQATSLVRAGRSQLLVTEQQVLQNTVTAYMNAIRDVSVLELNNNNVQVLERQLQASQDRFRVGEITRTDVAQSEARLAGSISARIRAEADLAGSRAGYVRVVGMSPGTLDQPPPLPPLPPNLDDATAIALEENPNVTAARQNKQAADIAVTQSKGALLPTVDGVASISRRESESFSPNVGNTVDFRNDVKSVGVQIRVPLYQGGAAYSDIRRAKHTRSQRRLQILSAERFAVEQARIGWEEYRAAQSSIESNSSQVRANTIALDGVRQEAAVGSRTTLDVLDAEQELLDSRVNLVRAERNEYVAGFALLGAVGRLNAKTLDLPVELYNPEKNYNGVRWQFVGWWTRD